MDESTNQLQETVMAVPAFRVWLCGAFRVERRIGTRYEGVRTVEWGGSNYPRLLLKALLCCPERQVRREALLEMLWPDASFEQAVLALNTATTKLRAALRPTKGQESLLLTENDAAVYRLPGQEQLWVDADAALAALKEVERLGRTSPQSLSLLEQATHHFNQGTFLDGEEGLWASGKRATIERTRYRARLWLAEAYEQQGMPGQAEMVISLLLEEDPTDEDALNRLMLLLHRQGMTQKALRLYENACQVFAEEGIEPSKTIKQVAAQLSEARDEGVPTSNNRVPLMSAFPQTMGYDILSVVSEQRRNVTDSLRRHLIEQALKSTGIVVLTSYDATLRSGIVERFAKLLQPESWLQLLSTEIDATRVNEATIQGFEKLIEACWQLSRGNELALAEELLTAPMSRLAPLAQQPSKYQRTTASLAAQGYQLYSILALHRNDLFSKEHYGKLSVQYSFLSGDQKLLIISLRQLADTYRYSNQYPQLLETYLSALRHIEGVSPLFQSCVYSGVGIAYAYLGQKQDALTYLGLAHDTFPDHPETDPGFSFADFDSPWLILREGILRYQIGEPKKALTAFKRIEQPNSVVPERIRIEIVNQHAKAAILSGDLEQGSTYVEAGVTGAKALGSQRRYNEAYSNFKQMSLLWPHERQVKALADLFLT